MEAIRQTWVCHAPFPLIRPPGTFSLGRRGEAALHDSSVRIGLLQVVL